MLHGFELFFLILVDLSALKLLQRWMTISQSTGLNARHVLNILCLGLHWTYEPCTRDGNVLQLDKLDLWSVGKSTLSHLTFVLCCQTHDHLYWSSKRIALTFSLSNIVFQLGWENWVRSFRSKFHNIDKHIKRILWTMYGLFVTSCLDLVQKGLVDKIMMFGRVLWYPVWSGLSFCLEWGSTVPDRNLLLSLLELQMNGPQPSFDFSG